MQSYEPLFNSEQYLQTIESMMIKGITNKDQRHEEMDIKDKDIEDMNIEVTMPSMFSARQNVQKFGPSAKTRF